MRFLLVDEHIQRPPSIPGRFKLTLRFPRDVAGFTGKPVKLIK